MLCSVRSVWLPGIESLTVVQKAFLAPSRGQSIYKHLLSDWQMPHFIAT